MLVSLSSCVRKIDENVIPDTEATVTADKSSETSKATDAESTADAKTTQSENSAPESINSESEAVTDAVSYQINSVSTTAPEETVYVPETSAALETAAPATGGHDTEYVSPSLYENPQIDPNRTSYDLGICRKLEGEIDVYLFFMDDDESSWGVVSADWFTKDEILPALEFLETNAKKWGKSLHFNTPIVYVTGGDKGFTMKYKGTVIKDLRVSETGSSKDVFEQAAQCIGYDSDYTLFDDYRKSTGRDNAIFLTLLNKDGVCYTRNQIKYKEYLATEHVVLFSNPPTTGWGMVSMHSATIAHEILHLYGAEDFYMGAREKIAAKVYPNDIMLHQYPYLISLNIGDYTAFTVGWTDVVPEVCSQEGWDDWRY